LIEPDLPLGPVTSRVLLGALALQR